MHNRPLAHHFSVLLPHLFPYDALCKHPFLSVFTILHLQTSSIDAFSTITRPGLHRSYTQFNKVRVQISSLLSSAFKPTLCIGHYLQWRKLLASLEVASWAE